MRVLCLLAFLLFAFSAHAQTDVIVNWRAPGGTTPVTNSNPLPISGSFSATLGGFAPSLAYATCTATASSCSSTALPTNSGSVVLFNTGTTTVSCTLASGVATALSSELQIPASSGLALATVYSATTYDHFACIDQTGSASNVVVASGGSGLPTGWGGGGGSAITNYALESGGNLASILSAVTGPIPAGTNNIGTVNLGTGIANVTPTDCSGTITSGGTAQNAFSAQTTLHGFTIVNIDTTEPLWISFTTTAAASGAGSYPLQAATATTFASAGSFTAPFGFGLNHALSVIAATTGHKFTCTWW